MIARARASASVALGFLTASAAFVASASAQAVSVRAEAGGSARLFPGAPAFGDQVEARVSPSFTFRPELALDSESGRWSLEAEAFARFDAHDDNRSHVDVRVLGVRYFGDRLTAFVGAGQVFWGVTEIRHLVDIVNQVDAVEDLDGEDKLGQPMLSLTLEGRLGAIDFYYLPYFRERPYPAGDARLRGPVPVAADGVYADGRGRWSPGFAGRAFGTFGSVDLGISGFRGTAREPRLELTTDGDGAPVLQASYDLIDQVGVDAQWTGERTLLKLESVTRGGHGTRLYALSGGVEYTVYGLLGSNGDLGVVGEVMLDSRGASAPPTIFQRDVFVGGRWAWNDVSDTSVLGGPLVDLETGEVLVLVEAERRIGSSWRFSVDARVFGGADPGSLVHGIRNDGHFVVSMTRYF